jgi:hypothetical protein
MFNTIARFDLRRLRRAASGPQLPVVPANDNLPTHQLLDLRARRPRLVCRWSLTGDGARIACSWQSVPLARDKPSGRLHAEF